MQIHSLRAFIETAIYGSFTAASRRLGQSPSSVSRAVDHLEKDLGIRLFARSTRKLRLTDEGEMFFERAQKALEELDAAKAELQGAKEDPSGRLRVTMPVVFGGRRIAPLFGSFLDQYPGLCIEATFTDRRVDLINENFDVAVRIGDLDDNRLIARRLGQVQYQLCGSADYLHRMGRPETLQDLRQHRCVYFRYPGTETPFKWKFRVDGQSVVWRPEGPVSVDDVDALVGCGVGGAGLIYVPSYRVQSHLDAGELVTVLSGLMPEPQQVAIVYTHSNLLATRVRAFVDFFRSAFSDALSGETNERLESTTAC